MNAEISSFNLAQTREEWERNLGEVVRMLFAKGWTPARIARHLIWRGLVPSDVRSAEAFVAKFLVLENAEGACSGPQPRHL